MVFCGKPSKGCRTCRDRKIRCDQAPEGCSQCAKVNRKCAGYRDQLDLMFRNESKDVVRKAKAKEARIKQGSEIFVLEPEPDILFEVVRWEDHLFPKFQLSVFSIAPTIEERATSFFFSNFVIGVHGPTWGHLDHLKDFYSKYDMDENLLASMKSVGLAGYSQLEHAPQLMKRARQEYMKALQLTNKALGSPIDAKKDTTLLAIMILGIFEMVTGCSQRSMKAWAEHINGSAALVKLRGREQLKTPPEHLIELRAEAAKYCDTAEHAWRVQESMIAFANFRSKTGSGEIADPQVILSTALEIDGTFLDIFSDLPPGWEYETVLTEADTDMVFSGRYHAYYDSWVAQLWNAMRALRILLNQQIRDVLLQGLSSKPPLFLGLEYTAQLQISTDILFQPQADILASVPQHFGGQTAWRCLGTGFAESPTPPLGLMCYTSSTPPMIRASLGGYFLLWSLYLAGSMDITTEPIRWWVIQKLQFIGWSMGIQQALVLAAVVGRREEVEVWYEK